MTTATHDKTLPEEFTLHVQKEISIKAPIEVAFDALLQQLGPQGEMPGGTPMQMKFEPWPGGRWFRDLGDNQGHLWGHVQVIKPPTLLEITGPMFMSYPALSHMQYRLSEADGGTHLVLTHQAIGLIDPEHREGVTAGWTHMLEQIRDIAQKQ